MLYRDLLGSEWDALPAPIRLVHERGGSGIFRVDCRATARVLSFFGLLPRPGERVLVTLHIERAGDTERWIRKFDDQTFATTQRVLAGTIREGIGSLEIVFHCVARSDALIFEMLSANANVGRFRIRLPRFVIPRVEAMERAAGERVAVTVRIGRSFAYTGYITPQ